MSSRQHRSSHQGQQVIFSGPPKIFPGSAPDCWVRLQNVSTIRFLALALYLGLERLKGVGSPGLMPRVAQTELFDEAHQDHRIRSVLGTHSDFSCFSSSRAPLEQRILKT
jgi:hypothetical protein